jgi:DNA-binding NarL/FixJ family response regulator
VDVEVVGDAANGADAVAATRALRPDVVVMDLRMPGVDGVEATRRITADATLPGVRVLVLTTFDHDEYVFGALRAGASGFVLKDAEPDELLRAIRVVAAGDSLLAPQLTSRLIAEFLARERRSAPPDSSTRLDRLTEREREVMVLVGLGLTNDEISDRLYISSATVRTHVSRIILKLTARDRVQLVVLAYQCGLVGPGAVG